MAGLKPPGPLSFQGSVAKNWKDWLSAYELYETASELNKKGDEVRYATFLHVAGATAQRIAKTFEFESAEVRKVEPLKKKFSGYCQPRRNMSVIRYLFNSRNQRSDETFSAYLTDLKVLISDCEFQTLEGEMLRDRIVCGIYDQGLREKLLQIENLSLQQCIDTCCITESSAQQIEQLQSSSDVHFLKGRQSRSRPQKARSSEHQRSPGTEKCANCTYLHRHPEYCPAAKEKCRKCGKMGHFSKSSRCRMNDAEYQQRSGQNDFGKDRDRVERSGGGSRHRHRDRREVKNIDADDRQKQTDDEYETDEEQVEVFIDLVVDELNTTEWTHELMIDGVNVTFKLDTGAQVNILPTDVFNNTNLTLDKSNVTLRSYSGHAMKPIGQTKCKVVVGKSVYFLTFQVVDGGVKPILGMRACKHMNLIQRCISDVTSAKPPSPPNAPAPTPNHCASADKLDFERSGRDPLARHAELFTGLGRLRNHEYNILIDHTVTPVKCLPRTTPHKLRDKVKAELDRMQELGVIERVNLPTDWVNAMTVVHKPDGRVRICLNPRGLNAAIKREHYPMPTFEQIAARIPNAQVFSKFDATSGYWQLPLTEESSYLTTFNTQFGRFRYNVMPFGISSASEIWQRAMVDEFGQLDGVEIVTEDILIWGTSIAQHDDRLTAFLKKVQSSGLKLNKTKSIIRASAIEYVGHVISSDGVKPSTERVKSIIELPYPSSKKEVETFLGMITYVGKFIPNLSEITSPLRELTQKGIAWHWSDVHAQSVTS
ncbi:uncharacterized protein K02A2.6-like [Lytechinus pictus]|uniref:uncharacterized protein K02A2.6-like n=1 Tax=Lytechinus pictus TaxID=7653 RepID=UPI0030BA188E